jgi:hypothetical protein
MSWIFYLRMPAYTVYVWKGLFIMVWKLHYFVGMTDLVLHKFATNTFVFFGVVGLIRSKQNYLSW